MIEGKEDKAKKDYGMVGTISSRICPFERDGLGCSGTSSISKNPTSPAIPSNPSLTHQFPPGNAIKSITKSPHYRSAIPAAPSQTSIIQARDLSEKQLITEQQPILNMIGQKDSGFQPSVVSPSSPDSESPRDLEKLSLGQNCPPEPSSFAVANCTSTADVDGDDVAEDDDPARHAMKILIFLSTLAPALSLTISLYTMMATLFILLLSPFCLLTTSNRIQRNFQRFLVPPLRFQLKIVHSDFDDQGTSRSSKPLMLVLINLLAPIYAVGVCMAAWVAAGFWFFAAILGDPNVKDKTERGKDDDGRTAVMTVRLWWERWLLRGLR